MPKIITQKAEENKQISERIKSFMKRFDVSSALKSSNAVKIKGFAVIEIFQYLFMLVFAHRSIYMDMKKDTVPFAKDTVYRFLNSARINWLRFTTKLSAKNQCSQEDSICHLRTGQAYCPDKASL